MPYVGKRVENGSRPLICCAAGSRETQTVAIDAHGMGLEGYHCRKLAISTWTQELISPLFQSNSNACGAGKPVPLTSQGTTILI